MTQGYFKHKHRVLFFLLPSLILVLLFLSPNSEAFDGADREPPRATEYRVLVRPTPENDWRIVFSLKTSDDRNIVSLPKMSFRVAFPWKPSNVSPAPKCQMGAQMEVALSGYEQMNLRNSDTQTVRQSFLFLGRIPPRPVLENSCPEFRDFSVPAIAAINGRGLRTTYNKGSVVPNYSGSIFEPKLEDASGRIYEPKNPSNSINSLDILPATWPNQTMETCLNDSSLTTILGQEETYQTLSNELARADELGNNEDFSQINAQLKVKEIASEFKNLLDGKLDDFSKFPLCPKMIQGSSALAQLKVAINAVKKSNDNYIKAKEAEVKKIERETAANLAQKRNLRISLADDEFKSLNVEYSRLTQQFADLTKISTVQSSTTSFGSKEKVASKNKAVEERKKILEKISAAYDKLREINNQKIAIESEAKDFNDKLSASFYQKLLSKTDQIRQAQMKIILMLLRYEQMYAKVTL